MGGTVFGPEERGVGRVEGGLSPEAGRDRGGNGASVTSFPARADPLRGVLELTTPRPPAEGNRYGLRCMACTRITSVVTL